MLCDSNKHVDNLEPRARGQRAQAAPLKRNEVRRDAREGVEEARLVVLARRGGEDSVQVFKGREKGRVEEVLDIASRALAAHERD